MDTTGINLGGTAVLGYAVLAWLTRETKPAQTTTSVLMCMELQGGIALSGQTSIRQVHQEHPCGES